MTSATQDHLSISDIHDDIVILKNGSMAIVMQTSAVNFGLLSEQEQLAIIAAFAGMLNSLSFMIQILVRSKRLDITNYLKQLDNAQSRQTNPLLVRMIDRYRNFIKNTVSEQEVLDKQFYIIVPLSFLELGLSRDKGVNFKKALTLLIPRRDHIIRQLSRIGLKATQLNSEQLVKLFYDIYNEDGSFIPLPTSPQVQATQTQNLSSGAATQQSTPNPTPQTSPSQQPSIQRPPNRPNNPYQQMGRIQGQSPIQRSKPYIVEELGDEYGTT